MYLLLISLMAFSECPKGNVKDIQHLFTKHNAKRAVLPSRLAPAVIKMSAKYCVDPNIVAAIIVVESKGIEYAYNEKTGDYGLLQINGLTAENMNISAGCRWDWRCNLEQGVRILSQFERTCQYNVGNGPLIGKRLKRCKKYEQKLTDIK